MNNRKIRFFVLLTFCLINAANSFGGDKATTDSVLLRTEVKIIKSKIIDQEFKIFVGLPLGYDKTKTDYPVLYVLDGNDEFALVVQIARMMQITGYLEKMVIVGIGYNVQYEEIVWRFRSRDFTPTNKPGWDKYFAEDNSGLPKVKTGGASRFLEFMKKELMPVINNDYRVKADDTGLTSHSLSALFSLYVLLNEPETFDRYLIASPTIWWNKKALFQYEEELSKKRSDLNAVVYIACAENEDEKHNYIKNMNEMAEKLRSRGYKNLKLFIKVFEGETHHSGLAPIMSRGLRALYKTVSKKE